MAFSLFKRDYNKPGPGVPKNAPRKKGFARFFELLGRDFSNLLKLNIIYQVCLLPAQVLFFFSILYMGTSLFLVFALLALVACIPIGPAKTAMSYIISKMLRDDPGFVWHDFKKLFKDNFRTSLVPGLFFGVITGAQIYAVMLFIASAQTNIVFAAIFFFSVLIFNMAAPYYFLQAGYLDLGVRSLLKNSLLLALGFVPRSLMGALLGAGLVAAQFLLFPLLLLLTALVGYTIPGLLCQMWVWPPIDKTFKVEKTLRERESGKTEEELLSESAEDGEKEPPEEET